MSENNGKKVIEKILLAEDHRTTRNIIKSHLIGLGYEVTEAEDGDIAWRLYQEHHYPLVITDWMMPGMSGPELVGKIREEEGDAHAYIILLTGKNDRESLIQGISAGADDYIIKPCHQDELAVRVRAGERIVDLQHRLQALAGTDPLTGLSNRRGLERTLTERRIGQSSKPTAFIIADIDHFKQVNDTYGHDAGDEVLKQLAERLRTAFRDTDAISRMGGEEFLIVAPEVNPFFLYRLTDRVRANMEKTPFLLPDGTEIQVTCSFGVTYIEPTDDLDADACIKVADQALYQSKENGRNRVTVIHPKEE